MALSSGFFEQIPLAGRNKEKYISPRNIVVVNSLDLPNDWNEEYGECYQ